MFLVVVSMIWLGSAQSGFALLAARPAWALPTVWSGPAIFAWAIDRSADERRGRAVGAVYIALEMGIGLGALLLAWLYDDRAGPFNRTFYVLGCLRGRVPIAFHQALRRK